MLSYFSSIKVRGIEISMRSLSTFVTQNKTQAKNMLFLYYNYTFVLFQYIFFFFFSFLVTQSGQSQGWTITIYVRNCLLKSLCSMLILYASFLFISHTKGRLIILSEIVSIRYSWAETNSIGDSFSLFKGGFSLKSNQIME